MKLLKAKKFHRGDPYVIIRTSEATGTKAYSVYYLGTITSTGELEFKELDGEVLRFNPKHAQEPTIAVDDPLESAGLDKSRNYKLETVFQMNDTVVYHIYLSHHHVDMFTLDHSPGEPKYNMYSNEAYTIVYHTVKDGERVYSPVFFEGSRMVTEVTGALLFRKEDDKLLVIPSTFFVFFLMSWQPYEREDPDGLFTQQVIYFMSEEPGTFLEVFKR